MQPEDRIRVVLESMVEAARAIGEFISPADLDDFERDDLIRSAVERKIEILGEGVRRLPEAFISAHPEVPWRAIAGQRNVLAHEYDDIRVDVIWKVASSDTPMLLKQLEDLLDKYAP